METFFDIFITYDSFLFPDLGILYLIWPLFNTWHIY